jgi:hypothetical protein
VNSEPKSPSDRGENSVATTKELEKKQDLGIDHRIHTHTHTRIYKREGRRHDCAIVGLLGAVETPRITVTTTMNRSRTGAYTTTTGDKERSTTKMVMM